MTSIIKRHPRQLGHGFLAPKILATSFLSLVTVDALPAQALRDPKMLPATPVAVVQLPSDSKPPVHRIELRDFDRRANPILTVVDRNNVQVASARARGGRLHLTIKRGRSEGLKVIVRSASKGSFRANLLVDGRVVASDLQFSAGHVIPVRGGAGRTLIGIGGDQPGQRHVLLALATDGRILDMSSGQRTAVRLGPGGRVIYGSDIVGPFRDLVNAPEIDSDGDQLDDHVEQWVGTCASRTGTAPGVNCQTVADTRDTDGDGLLDGWEVMGFRPAAYGVASNDYLPLHEWGADPRHKDLFLEIDFRRLTKADNDAALEMRMSPQSARSMAAVYADTITTDPAIRALHAASVGNPDGKPGIALHLDTGVAPETPADSTLFGDWGGYNAVDAIPDPADPLKYIPQTPAVWTSQMSLGRRGIFHYVLGYTTGGGACGYGIACGFNFASTFVSTHEFGHTLGSDHDGTFDIVEPNCKPNYPSLMSYGGYSQFSDGRDLGVLNDHSLSETGGVTNNPDLLDSLRTKYRYGVDPVTGSVDWNRDNVFAPAGSTVRANANYVPGGGCESTRDDEKPTGLLSGRSPAIVNLGGHLWVFSVTTDGKFAHTLTPPQFNCANVDDCPTLTFHAPTVRDISVSGLDAARIVVNGRPMILIVGIRPDGTLFETWVEYSGGRYIWGGPVDIPASPAAGEPSLAASLDGKRVALAYKGPDGTVYFRYRSPGSFQPERTAKLGGQPLIISGKASPGLAFTHLRFPTDITAFPAERLIAAFPAGPIDLYFPSGGDEWTKIPVPYERAATVAGRPSLAWVAPPPPPVIGLNRGAIRPGLLADVPSPAGTGWTLGRLYVTYTQAADPVEGEPLPNPLRMMMSYVDTSGTRRIGLDSFFDNVWAFAYGMDLLQPGETALRAAVSYSLRKALNQVYVRPHADGIVNLPYRNFDDWKVLAWGSCTTIHTLQPLQQKITCAPKGW